MPKPAPVRTPDDTSGSPVTTGEILSALSYALDVTEGARPGHSVRTCLLGMRLGERLGLPGTALDSLYYALLLKDIGCSSNAARMAQAFAADDQVVKHHFKFIDREKLGKPNREAIAFAWDNIAPGTSVWHRIGQFYRMVSSPGDLTSDMIGARCERGAVILQKLGMSIETCAAVYSLDEHWNGQGLPDRLFGKDIPLLARICAVAQHLDLFCSDTGPDKAVEVLLERSGTWYDPEVVRAAESMHREGTLWELCLPDSDPAALQPAVMALDPGHSSSLASHDIDLICSGFADVVDAKSPFTFRHSVGTTEAAVLIGNAMGLSPERVEVVRRAALLHDIGMLSVPNIVLDKPAPLTSEEWARVHRHPLLSQEILSRVRAFGQVAELAAQHHERLDGSGYPLRLTDGQISLESRILTAADVFTALWESRSYRDDLSPADIRRELAQEVPSRLDGDTFDAALSVMDQLALLPLEDVPAMSAESMPDLVLVDPPPFRFLPPVEHTAAANN